MKIIKIFSNDSSKFHNIEFNEGFNVVIARIYDKTKTDKDCHNLGKTLLISLIDFLLLKTINRKDKFFLTSGDFVGESYFIELKLNSGKFLIINRTIDNPTKISFKVNNEKLKNFCIDFAWNEKDMSLDKAKEWLNNQLAFDVLKTWKYRKPINYFLRSQRDFRDVFKLDKFKGKDVQWKPFMFELMGFNATLVKKKYDLEQDSSNLKSKIQTIKDETKINTDDRDKIQGLIQIKLDEINQVEQSIEKFNFSNTDEKYNDKLVDELDNKIRLLNSEKYYFSNELNKIKLSLSNEEVSLDLKKLFKMFEEVELYFPQQIKNDYNKLLKFNYQTLKERRKILKENLTEVTNKLLDIDVKLCTIQNEKERIIDFLVNKGSYDKFKEIQKNLSKLEGEKLFLENKLKLIDQASLLIEKVNSNNLLLADISKSIHNEITTQKHYQIRKIFNQIVKIILSTNALLSITQNKSGNIEFDANIQNPEDLKITNEDKGNSYRKLLCMAFDISIMIHYSSDSFYRFIYHDGTLEAMDDRKKIKFIDYIKDICSKHQVQYIMTLIDSDLPRNKNDEIIDFDEQEIALELHDRDDTGKLFKRSF